MALFGFLKRHKEELDIPPPPPPDLALPKHEEHSVPKPAPKEKPLHDLSDLELPDLPDLPRMDAKPQHSEHGALMMERPAPKPFTPKPVHREPVHLAPKPAPKPVHEVPKPVHVTRPIHEPIKPVHREPIMHHEPAVVPKPVRPGGQAVKPVHESGAQPFHAKTQPVHAKPSSLRAAEPMRPGPIYLKADYYTDALRNVDMIIDKLKDADGVAKKLNDLKNEKDKEFEKFRNYLEEIQRKSTEMDRTLFA